MRTAKENKAATIDDLQETLKKNNAAPLITEAELGELLRKNGAPTDREIAEKLAELGTITHTPEEIREKERLEAIIADAEARLAEIDKQMAEIKKKFAKDYIVPSEAVEKYHSLKAEKHNVKAFIDGNIEEIRRISAGKIENRNRNNDYMNQYGIIHNEIIQLEKSMKLNEDAGDLPGYENVKKLYFEKKAELKKLKENKPEPIKENPTGADDLQEFIKEVRKNALTKILYYSGQIDKALEQAKQTELDAIDVIDNISWQKYRENKFNRPAWSDAETWTAAFYAGLKSHYKASGIKSMLQEMK